MKSQIEKIREELYTKGYKKFPKIIENFDRLILKIVDGKEKLSDIKAFRDKLIRFAMKK